MKFGNELAIWFDEEKTELQITPNVVILIAKNRFALQFVLTDENREEIAKELTRSTANHKG